MGGAVELHEAAQPGRLARRTMTSASMPPQPAPSPDQPGGYPLALVLAALAGAVDAVGIVHWGGLFVSFMSGNSTMLGAKAASGGGADAAVSLSVIVAFVAGVMIGELLLAATGSYARAAVLLLETVLLGVGACASWLGLAELATAPVLSLAMGVQNASMHRAAGINVALTYVTGTLVNIGRGVAKALSGQAAWSATLPFLGLWCGLVSGAALGAFVALRSEVVALTGAAATALLLASIVAALTWDRAGLAP